MNCKQLSPCPAALVYSVLLRPGMQHSSRADLGQHIRHEAHNANQKCNHSEPATKGPLAPAVTRLLKRSVLHAAARRLPSEARVVSLLQNQQPEHATSAHSHQYSHISMASCDTIGHRVTAVLSRRGDARQPDSAGQMAPSQHWPDDAVKDAQAPSQQKHRKERRHSHHGHREERG